MFYFEMNSSGQPGSDAGQPYSAAVSLINK